jgi:hypothetical protein
LVPAQRDRNAWDLNHSSFHPRLTHSGNHGPAVRRAVRLLWKVPIRRTLLIVLIIALSVPLQPSKSWTSAQHFLNMAGRETFFAINPDLTIRRINPWAPDKIWTLGKGSGIPPLYYRITVPGMYDRVDFFYPFGLHEESIFQSKLRFSPFFESRWAKTPPFEGWSRCLTLYQGRSDLGQEYWGFFPFYGYSYRRFGVDKNLFLLFPLYYESSYDDARTMRFLWPFITYANSPGRQAVKVWPLFGKDAIGKDYYNNFILWPFIQMIDKYPGTKQASSYRALPFPLYMTQTTPHDSTTDVVWPFLRYYHHRPTGHSRYSFWPLVTYGTGGGIEEFSVLFLYSSKKDLRKGTSDSGNSGGYISIGDDEIFTEKKFLLINTIQKRYKKGLLVQTKYRFWPFAEYNWDVAKGSHLAIPEIIPLKNDWFDVNLGKLLRVIDIRDTPITRELSFLFGLSKKTHYKRIPHINRPPKPGEDDWAELISGAFANR